MRGALQNNKGRGFDSLICRKQKRFIMETLDFSNIDQWETTPNFDGLGLDKRRCQVRVYLLNYLAKYRKELSKEKETLKKRGYIAVIGAHQGVYLTSINFLRSEIEAVKMDLRNARKLK